MPKGKKLSLATRRLMSLRARGKNNPFYGKHHTAETKRKISLATRGKNNPFYGHHHTEAIKRKLRAMRLAAIRKGK